MMYFRKQQGLSLIEVLIALLVLSIGMVGMGALLLTSLSNVHSSSHYSLASALALDLEERLWLELSEISASAPASLNNGCLTDAQIETVRSETVTEWSEPAKDDDSSWKWTTSQRMRLPGLAVRIEAITPVPSGSNGDIRWQTMTPVISWDEGRFDDVADAAKNEEEFAGSISVICRPTFASS